MKQTVLRFLAVSMSLLHHFLLCSFSKFMHPTAMICFYNRIISFSFLCFIFRILISDNSFGQSSSIRHQILSGKHSVVYHLFLPGTFTSAIPVYLFSRLRTFHVNRIKGRVLSVSQHSLYSGICLFVCSHF